MEIIFFVRKRHQQIPTITRRLKLIKKIHIAQASVSSKDGSKIASLFDWKKKKIADALFNISSGKKCILL